MKSVHEFMDSKPPQPGCRWPGSHSWIPDRTPTESHIPHETLDNLPSDKDLGKDHHSSQE